MDLLIDENDKSLIRGHFFNTQSATNPFQVAVTDAQTFSVGLVDPATGDVLASVDALGLASNVTHSPGGYPGFQVNLPLADAALLNFLGDDNSKAVRLEITRNDGATKRSFLFNITLHRVDLNITTTVGELAAVQYVFPNIDLATLPTTTCRCAPATSAPTPSPSSSRAPSPPSGPAT